MRFIDTKTLELKEFFGNQIPPYAILSHTWQEEEVSFQDWANRSSVSQKKGYKKIFDTCQLARNQGYGYVWVDTNCIDKSSSAELTESINYMFKWYQYAQICYVYLSDVSADLTFFDSNFLHCRWFTRGWTLQELLAPRDIEFYSTDWTLLGTKESMCFRLSNITNINTKYLWVKHIGDHYITGSDENLVAQSVHYAAPLQKASVAERLSWLSGRQTTRLEDMAYCMLGIFELNMPLLYGENSKAFIRLQEEIMKTSDDHSLFCWTWNSPENGGGFLSSDPSEFSNAGRFASKQEDKRPAPYALTNAGLQIKLPVLYGWKRSFIGVLRVTTIGVGKTFGLPMSGDLITGRVSRGPFPSEPMPLCDDITHNQKEHNIFVSGKYSESHTNKAAMMSIPKAKVSDKFARHQYNQFFVLLTFGEQQMANDIKTYPPDRFDRALGSINVYSPVRSSRSPSLLQYLAGEAPIKPFIDDQHTYEGVLVQLDPKGGQRLNFMIAVRRKFDPVQRHITTSWNWHCWQIRPNAATAIFMGSLHENSPIWKNIHRAVKDPEYAQQIDRAAHQFFLSPSMAKDCVFVDGKAVCHMHIS